MEENEIITELEVDFALELAKVPEQYRSEYKQICETWHTNDEQEFVDIYLNALMTNDANRIAEMRNYCTNETFEHGKMFYNMNYYREAKRYGFTKFTTNEIGWFDEGEWPHEEDVEIRVKGDKHFAGNYINLKMGPNGKWSYGVNRSYGVAGGGCHAGLFRTLRNSRHEALSAALQELQADHLKAVNYKDSANYKPAYIKLVLAKIESMLQELQQLETSTENTLSITIENTNPNSEPFYLFNPSQITQTKPTTAKKSKGLAALLEPVVEEVQGLQQLAMFSKEKAPKVYANKYGYQGKDKTDRQRVKRKIDALVKKIKELPAEEQAAIISAVQRIKNR